MNKRTAVVISALILGSALLTAPAFTMKKVAQSKLQFLKLEMGARAIALAGAYRAVSGDPNCIFYNPAGTAFVDGLGLAFNYSSWLAGTSYQSAAASYTAGRWGTFTANYLSVQYGEFERTVVDAHAWEGYQSLGTFDVGEYAFGLGYSHQITDRLFIGGQAKYAYQRLGSSQIWEYVGSDFEATKEVDNETDVVAYDFGTLYNSGFKNLCIGIAVQNFANKPIPLNFRFGMAVDLNQIFFPDRTKDRLTFSYEIQHPRDYTERVQFGLEYAYRNLIFLRGGYKINFDEQSWSAGIGCILSYSKTALQIDYAIVDFSAFGFLHRASIGVSL